MAGQCLAECAIVNSSHLVHQAVETWMGRTLKELADKGVQNLHVDEINEDYTKRELWPVAALACFEAASLVRDRRNLSITVAMGIGLRPGRIPQGASFADWQEVWSEVDDAPPSLYIWEHGSDPIGIRVTQTRSLDAAMNLPTSVPCQVLLSEWHDPRDDEFRRTLWLLSP